ncbi:hypothetical protein SS50377_26683 [Spironucleus salmonicida]|uniref:Uncharacterized protein n=1 Tax=Spironucleus salmonicida TaxID=348837 RepID=V6LY56_9EUKA|nr:hypothetical protein SS50377_26683 [Spironucleus salmonicida]|eukprot:EST49158.1 Hypothetical protein SS50377_10371 [Spironucleus salmonicida]
MNQSNKLLEQVDRKISNLRTRLQDTPKTLDLTENYTLIHVQKSPFNPLPKVLPRAKTQADQKNLTNATKRQLCIKTLQQHQLLKRELDVLKKRTNQYSSPQRSTSSISYSYEEKPNYREQYEQIKQNDIQQAKIKRRAVKELEFKARLEKEKNILQKNLEAQDIKVLEDEIRVRKMEQKLELAAYTQNLRAKQQNWKEVSTIKKQQKQIEISEKYNEEMDNLVLEVIDKEDEIRQMQKEIQELKTKLYGEQQYNNQQSHNEQQDTNIINNIDPNQQQQYSIEVLEEPQEFISDQQFQQQLQVEQLEQVQYSQESLPIELVYSSQNEQVAAKKVNEQYE